MTIVYGIFEGTQKNPSGSSSLVSPTENPHVSRIKRKILWITYQPGMSALNEHKNLVYSLTSQLLVNDYWISLQKLQQKLILERQFLVSGFSTVFIRSEFQGKEPKVQSEVFLWLSLQCLRSCTEISNAQDFKTYKNISTAFQWLIHLTAALQSSHRTPQLLRGLRIPHVDHLWRNSNSFPSGHYELWK